MTTTVNLPCAVCTTHPHDKDTDCLPECRNVDADLGVICSKCAQRIRNDLDSIVEAYALTEDPGFPTQGGDGRAKTRPLPGGTEWMDWRQGSELFGVLTSWCQDWMETYARSGPKHQDLASMTNWLRANLSTAANSHPAILEFADEIHTLARRGLRLVDGKGSDRHAVECPSNDCGHVLRISMGDLEHWHTCPSCEIRRSAAQILNLLNDSAAWVDLEVAVIRTKVPASTLKRWAKQEKIERRNGLYRLGSIKEHQAGEVA